MAVFSLGNSLAIAAAEFAGVELEAAGEGAVEVAEVVEAGVKAYFGDVALGVYEHGLSHKQAFFEQILHDGALAFLFIDAAEVVFGDTDSGGEVVEGEFLMEVFRDDM